MQETEGESLTRPNRLSLDTEVSNSAVKLHYLLMPMNRQSFSSTCHLKLCGSWIGFVTLNLCKVLPSESVASLPKQSFLRWWISHCCPQPTSLNIQILKPEPACSFKNDHKILNVTTSPESKAILPQMLSKDHCQQKVDSYTVQKASHK